MQISIPTTHRKQIVDITDIIKKTIDKSQIKNGLCIIFVTHTTCAVTTADLDPGTDLDMLDAFDEMIPNLTYRHPHNPNHVGDHIMASLIGPNITVPVENAELVLGTWQRIVLVELDGPRHRALYISTI